MSEDCLPIDDDIFRLSVVIARDYLRLDRENSDVQEKRVKILDNLEKAYVEEGCRPDGSDQAEKMFILRSLPQISCFIQLSTTITHFNDAMRVVEDLYDTKDNPFDSATKLSYLIFAFAIHRGSLLFSGAPGKSETWKQMRSQMARLLQPRLSINSDGSSGSGLGKFFYDRALASSKQVLELGKRKTLTIANSKPSEDSEIKKIESQIQIYTDKAAQMLREAIDIDPRYQNQAKDVKAFSVIWYSLARDYAQNAGLRLGDLERIKTWDFDEEHKKESETIRVQAEIDDVSARAIDSLNEAIKDSQYKKRARTDGTFDWLRTNPSFPSLSAE